MIRRRRKNQENLNWKYLNLRIKKMLSRKSWLLSIKMIKSGLKKNSIRKCVKNGLKMKMNLIMLKWNWKSKFLKLTKLERIALKRNMKTGDLNLSNNKINMRNKPIKSYKMSKMRFGEILNNNGKLKSKTLCKMNTKRIKHIKQLLRKFSKWKLK